MNITAVCPSLVAPLIPLSEMEIIERREHKFNCSETFRVPVYLCNWGRIDINMKHSQRGMRWLDKRFDLDKNLDGAGIMYLRV